MNTDYINSCIDLLNEKVSRRKFQQEKLKKWEIKQENGFNRLENLELVKVIFQKATQITQIQLSKQISSIVSQALKAVFLDDAYEFKANFVTRRNTTECDLLFIDNGKERKPLSSCGFGAADIASLALRIAYWKLDGTCRNTIICDEPFRNLDVKRQELASLMIKKLSQMKGGLQFLIVTHNIALAKAADCVFKVKKIDKVSKIEQLN